MLSAGETDEEDCQSDNEEQLVHVVASFQEMEVLELYRYLRKKRRQTNEALNSNFMSEKVTLNFIGLAFEFID